MIKIAQTDVLKKLTITSALEQDISLGDVVLSHCTATHTRILSLQSEGKDIAQAIAWIALSEQLPHLEGSLEIQYEQCARVLKSLLPEDLSLTMGLALLEGTEIQSIGIDAQGAPMPLSETSPTLVSDTAQQITVSGHIVVHNPNISSGPLAWTLLLNMQAQALKSINPVPYISAIFSNSPVMQVNSAILSTVVAELFSNSLEHGVLRLDSDEKSSPDGMMRYYANREAKLTSLESGSLELCLSNERSPGERSGTLCFQIHNSGPGFDWKQTLADIQAQNQNYSGRGFHLIRSLCDTLSFSDSGTTVQVEYTYPKSDD